MCTHFAFCGLQGKLLLLQLWLLLKFEIPIDYRDQMAAYRTFLLITMVGNVTRHVPCFCRKAIQALAGAGGSLQLDCVFGVDPLQNDVHLLDARQKLLNIPICLSYLGTSWEDRFLR